MFKALEAIDALSFGRLLLLAIAFLLGTQPLRYGNANVIAHIASGLFLVVNFVHCFAREEEFSPLFTALVRSILAREVVHGMCLVLYAGVTLLKRELRRIKERHESLKARLAAVRDIRRAKEVAERRIEEEKKAMASRPTVTLSRLDKLQLLADAVQRDFDHEIAALDRMKLDKHERSVLYMRARQRFLKRLQQFGET